MNPSSTCDQRAARVFLVLILISGFGLSEARSDEPADSASKSDNRPTAQLIRRRVKKAESKHWKGRLRTGLITWEDPLKLHDGTAQTTPLLANIYAFTAGVVVAYGTRTWEWDTQFSGFYGFANIGGQAGTVSYFQDNVNISGALVSTGPCVLVPRSHAAFGINLVGLYRTGAWQVPGPSYGITPISLITEGANLEARWNFNKWALVQSVGSFKGINSAFWTLQADFFL